jgi:phage terminase large subunit GpA-like protein
LDRGQIEGRIETNAEDVYSQLDIQVLNRRWHRSDGKLMPLFRAFQDAGGAPGATGIVHRFVNQRSYVLSAYIGRATTDIVGPWKRTTSTQFHGRLFQANVSNYKQQLADKLSIQPGVPGSIHFGSESRGFDEEFFLQLLSEHKEVKLSRGARTIVWKRIRDRNEGLDMVVMVLCLLDVYRSQIDRMSEPQIVGENGEKSTATSEAAAPKWGAQTVNVTDPYIQMLQAEQRAQRVQQAPNGMRWGVQNRGVEW